MRPRTGTSSGRCVTFANVMGRSDRTLDAFHFWTACSASTRILNSNALARDGSCWTLGCVTAAGQPTSEMPEGAAGASCLRRSQVRPHNKDKRSLLTMSSTSAMLDQLNASPPWQRISDRLSCLTDDPACRSNVLVHAGLLALIIVLAASRKVFLAAQSAPEPKFSMAQVESIMVYPVKSAQGVRLTESMIKRKGIELDRRWIVLKKNVKSGQWEKIILKDEPKVGGWVASMRMLVCFSLN